MIRGVVATAPGKVTLFGEHAVVYGEPAIVTAINKRLEVEVTERKDDLLKIRIVNLPLTDITIIFRDKRRIGAELSSEKAEKAVAYIKKAIELTSRHIGEYRGVNITVRSDMPVSAGLGTSAAVSVATITAYSTLLGKKLSLEEIARLGYLTELGVQGAASPMDTSITTYGGSLYIKPTEGGAPIIRKVELPPNMKVVIGYVPRTSTTKELVAEVKELKSTFPVLIENIMKTIGELTERALDALKREDLKSLGKLMDINHGLLSSLGVSTRELDIMVYAAREAGALGAKLTGAGGGGCIIAIVPRDKLENVISAIEVVGGRAFAAEVNCPGVKASPTI